MGRTKALRKLELIQIDDPRYIEQTQTGITITKAPVLFNKKIATSSDSEILIPDTYINHTSDPYILFGIDGQVIKDFTLIKSHLANITQRLSDSVDIADKRIDLATELQKYITENYALIDEDVDIDVFDNTDRKSRVLTLKLLRSLTDSSVYDSFLEKHRKLTKRSRMDVINSINKKVKQLLELEEA